MQLALSIPDVAEEICKAVEQSASPEMAVVNTNRELLKNRLIKILSAQPIHVASNAADIGETFRRLAKEWREETAHISSLTKMVMHPKYQRIIGMGPAVLPILFRELQKNPDHWFWALQAITEEDPTRPEDLGDVHKMTESWLQWAQEKGYL
ncbi:hypothetical protein L0337_24735 [candidate division KSB1 bacterium]|nr:hypothetical protein [candidate division KSB1 bacterium]